MVKTIILDGSETKVDGLGDRNIMIINNGSGPVYASANPNVEAFADNVIAIQAGQRDIIPETYGTIYLLGTGNVECRGVRYVNFNQPSSQSSGGGGGTSDVTKAYVDNADVVTLQSAKTYTDSKTLSLTNTELDELLTKVFGPEPKMPYMNGIVGYFPYNTVDLENALWKNKLDGGNDIILTNAELGANEILFNSETRGQFNCEEPPLVFYAVLKLNSSATGQKAFLYRKRNTGNDYADNSLWLKTNSNQWRATIDGSFDPIFGDNQTYQAVAVVENLGVSGIELKGYSDNLDAPVTKNQNKSGSLANIKLRYSGVTGINDDSLSASVKFIAFGTEIHTDEQIIANCQWLKKKYLGE